MDYLLKSDDYKLYVCGNQNMYIYDTTFQKYINQLLRKHLIDLDSRERNTKRMLGFKSKIPIYINQRILLMCIRSYRLENSFYINYYSIRDFKHFDGHILINFNNNHTMKIRERHTFLKQLEKCRMIIDFLNNQKMLS